MLSCCSSGGMEGKKFFHLYAMAPNLKVTPNSRWGIGLIVLVSYWLARGQIDFEAMGLYQ